MDARALADLFGNLFEGLWKLAIAFVIFLVAVSFIAGALTGAAFERNHPQFHVRIPFRIVRS